MKVAVIGARNNGSAHARCLAALDDVAVGGVTDPEPDRAERLAREVGANPFTDDRAMLDTVEPEAVWISSPCWLHAQQTVDCAEAGAHVMCEKLMALDLEDCDRMVVATMGNTI